MDCQDRIRLERELAACIEAFQRASADDPDPAPLHSMPHVERAREACRHKLDELVKHILQHHCKAHGAP